MAKLAKIAGWAGVFVLYAWVQGVRNIDEVKRRKRWRGRLDRGG